jgi:hypothetical protein
MRKRIIFILVIFVFALKVNAQTGIGTTTPAVKLHIKSNAATFRLEGTDHTYMELFPQGSSTRFGFFGYPSASSTNFTMMNENASGSLILGTNNLNRLTIDNSGNTSLTGNLTGGNSSTSNISGFAANVTSVSANYPITSADNGKVIQSTSASAITITIPTGLPTGFNCTVVQMGAGQVTFSGTYLNRTGFNKTASQYSVVSILHLGSNNILVTGEMSN